MCDVSLLIYARIAIATDDDQARLYAEELSLFMADCTAEAQ